MGSDGSKSPENGPKIGFLVVWQNSYHRRIQRGFGGGQPVWDPKFLSQINEKLKILKSYNLYEFSFIAMSHTIDNYLITTFFHSK